LSAVFGIFAIILAYLIGTRLFRQDRAEVPHYNRRGCICGLVTAGLVALFPPFITHTHYITPEVYQTAFMLAATYVALLYLDKPTTLKLFIISALSALTFCEKYPGLWCLVTVFAVVIMSNPIMKCEQGVISIDKKNVGNALKYCLVGVIFFGVCVFFISPVLLTDIVNVFARIGKEAAGFRPGADGLGTFGNIFYYFKTFISHGGILLFASAIVGLIVLLKRNVKVFAVMFIGVLYIVFLSFFALHWDRWGVPFYAYMTILAGYGIFSAFEWVIPLFKKEKTRVKSYVPAFVLGALCLLVFVNLASRSVSNMMSFAVAKDTRVASLDYCAEIGSTQDNTAWEGYTPHNPTGAAHLNYDINTLRTENPHIQYVIISSGMYSRYYAEPERFAEHVAVYEKLKTEYEEIKRYSSYADKGESWLEIANIHNNFRNIGKMFNGAYSGPTIIIYKVKEVDA
jgi:hypothetical protein